MPVFLRPILVGWLLFSFSSFAVAQPAEPPPAESPLADKLGSPRAVFITFQNAMVVGGDSDDAVLCLDPDASLQVNRVVCAYDLFTVLGGAGKIDPRQVPDRLEDGEIVYRLSDYFKDRRSSLSAEQFADIGFIYLQQDSDGLWRFSAQSLKDLYNRNLVQRARERLRTTGEAVALPPRSWSVWLRDLFPASLHDRHFLLPDYQWISLLFLIALGFAVDFVSRWLLRSVTHAWFRWVRDKEDYQAERKLWRPLGLLTQAVTWYVGTIMIGLPDLMQTILEYGLAVFTVFAAVWTSFLTIDLAAAYLMKRAAGTLTKFDDLLAPLISKSLKVFAVCIGVITCAQALGWPIAGLLGGLGIGGAAIAFASKDAISNFFGSVTVLTDRPFEIGDWIITEGIEGSVEMVGFRSTRIRTFYNSLITLPNSRLTTAVVDNMGRRRYRRIKATLGLQYNTTHEQIDAFCEGVRELIRRNPMTRKDYFHVYLNAFSESSLDVMLYCFVECSTWTEELQQKHTLFSGILQLAQKLGISFAFPTRTLHMFQEDRPPEALPLSAPEDTGRLAAAELFPEESGSRKARRKK